MVASQPSSSPSPPFIERLLIDSGTTRESIPNPTWEAIEDAIWQLDGHTRLFLYGPAESLLILSGGPAWFQATLTPGLDADPVHLIDPSQALDRPIKLRRGSRIEERPAEEALSIFLVLQAARTFHKRGTPDPHLAWTP